MAANRTNTNNPIIISTAQLKDTLREIIQHNANLSSYKLPVLREIMNYLNEVERRFLFGTNPQRLRRVHEILTHINDHDLTFLAFVIDQTLNIENEGSSLRDNVGKAAAEQFIRALAGFMQSLLFLTMIYFATTALLSSSLSKSAFSLLIVMCCINLMLVADHLQSAFSTGLTKSEHLPTSLTGIFKEAGKNKISDALALPLKMADKTIAETITNISNSVNNVRDTVRSQINFFSQPPQENQPQSQPQVQQNAPIPGNVVNPAGQPSVTPPAVPVPKNVTPPSPTPKPA